MTQIRLNEIRQRVKRPTNQPYQLTQAEIDCSDLLEAYELLFDFLDRNIGKRAARDTEEARSIRWQQWSKSNS